MQTEQVMSCAASCQQRLQCLVICHQREAAALHVKIPVLAGPHAGDSFTF